jgi:hypothetical protein
LINAQVGTTGYPTANADESVTVSATETMTIVDWSGAFGAGGDIGAGAAENHEGNEPASQPTAVNGHFLVDLPDLIREPFHLKLQAADLLAELLLRIVGVVILAARHQAPAVGRLQRLELGGLGLMRVGRER